MVMLFKSAVWVLHIITIGSGGYVSISASVTAAQLSRYDNLEDVCGTVSAVFCPNDKNT